MKTIFITGASTGIGKTTAAYFSQNGWNVAATMRTPEKDTEVKNLANTKVYTTDVTKPETIQAALQAAIKDFGQIDVLVNNAGFAVDGVFEAMTEDDFKKQFDTNVIGLLSATKIFVQYFRENNIKGNIIQIASVGGKVTFPLYSIYHGTKWAVEGFSESLHYELKHLGIKIKLVEPGAIKTDFYTRSRHFVKPTNTNVYDAFVDKCEKLNMETGAKGADPIVVAKTIFKAATDNSNKLRYPIGYPANLLLPLRKLLPESWFFAVVRMNYKL
jgi:short-subunit dehydrogenase